MSAKHALSVPLAEPFGNRVALVRSGRFAVAGELMRPVPAQPPRRAVA
jgi:hypothetical protein